MLHTRTPAAWAPAGAAVSNDHDPAKRARAVARRRDAVWDVLAVATCTCLVGLGSAVAWYSGGLTGPTATHGQAVGVLCIILGLLGWLASGMPLAPSALEATSALGLLETRGGRYANGGPGAMKRLSHALGLPLRTALLVGTLAAALGTVGLIEQASADVGAHCVMAEAAVRINHLEEVVTKLKHDELITQIFFRMGELDDLLHATAHGTTAHAELRAQTFSLMHQDREMIRERVGRLHRHAQTLLQEMKQQMEEVEAALAHAEDEAHEARTGASDSSSRGATAGEAGAGGAPAGAVSTDADGNMRKTVRPVIHSWIGTQAAKAKLEAAERAARERAEELTLLQQRVQAVESVLQYIDARSHDAHSDLTFDEYQIILGALLDGTSQQVPSAPSPQAPGLPGGLPPPAAPSAVIREALSKDMTDAPSLEAAFQRRAAGGGGYEGLVHSDPRFQVVSEVAARREAARKDFEKRFFGVYEGGAGHTQPQMFQASLSKALDSLPQHCLSDTAAFSRLRWLTLGLLVAQALTAHSVLTSLTGKVLAAGKDA